MVSNSLPSTSPYGNYTVVDTVPKGILHMVDPHWYQFPPMNPLWYGLVGFWMVVMGTLSVFGNFVVIWVFTNTNSLRSPANLLVVNLAVPDFFMMLTMFPSIVINCYWKTWIQSAVFCEVYAFPGSLFGWTPLFSIWSSVFAKANAVYNPNLYAISHPKYKAALEKLPFLSCATEGRDSSSETVSTATATAINEKSESAEGSIIHCNELLDA
ncbi:rhodopsin-like [Homarus americanus]|uniref:rhodopsin-like n=1 Tax=Homarus americanus TaxID=6706 RepID=UPI001C44C874|nr:rhodopsin-like [Homarus americanus]